MMKGFSLAAALFALTIAAPAFAQSSLGPGVGIVVAQAQTATEEAKPARRSRKKKDGASTKELTVNQMAHRERQKKCGAEWKEAKAAGKTGGLKWPKFYSQCNARLKGSSA